MDPGSPNVIQTSVDDWDVQSPPKRIGHLGSMKPFSEGEPGSCRESNSGIGMLENIVLRVGYVYVFSDHQYSPEV